MDVLGTKVSPKLPISITYILHITSMDAIFTKLYIIFIPLSGTLENILV